MPLQSHCWERSRSSTTPPAPSARGRRGPSRSSPTSRCTPASPQTRQRIAALFWPDSTDAQALTNLRRELHTCATCWPESPCLVVTARDLCWQDTAAVQVDVRSFDRERAAALGGRGRGDAEAALAHAEAALADYRGDLLPGHVRRLAARRPRRAAGAQCVELCALSARPGPRRATRPGRWTPPGGGSGWQPLEEAGYRVLMELQADLGDRAGALSTYHRAPRSWSASSASSPDEATRATLRRVMADEPRRRPAAASGEPAGRPGRPARALGRARPSSACCGRPGGRRRRAAPGVVLVRGGAGVGQDPAGHRARRGRSPAGRRGRREPVLRHVGPARARAGRRLAAQPGGAVAADRARPGVARGGRPAGAVRRRPRRTRRPGRGRWSTPGSGTASSRGSPGPSLGAGRPTLLVLDNLQWCDQETLAFLTFCLGLAAGAPCWWPRPCASTVWTTSPSWPAGSARMRAARPAHRAHARPAGRPPTPPGSPRRSAAARSRTRDRDAAAGGDGRLPAARRRGRARVPAARSRVAAGRRPRTPSCAAASTQAEPGRPGGRRPGRGGRPRLHPRPARRGQRPGRRQRRAGGRRAVAPADPARARRRLRLLPRPAARRRLRAGQPAAALAAAPAARPGPGAAARRRPRPGRRPSSPSSTPAAAGPSGPSPTTAARPTSRRACSRTPRRSGCTPRRWPSCGRSPRGRDRDGQELALLEAMAAPLNARYGYSSHELQAVLERVGRAGRVARPRGLAAQRAGRALGVAFVQGRVADAHRTATRALALVERRLRPERRGPLRLRRVGRRASARPAEALRHLELAAALATGTRRSASAPAPTCTAGPGPRTRTGCSADDDAALASMREADRAGPGVRPPVQPRGGAGLRGITHQLRGDRAGAAAARSPSCASSASATASPTTASGGWCSTAGPAAGDAGHRARPAGYRQPARRRRASPGCRTGSPCWPTCWTATGAARTRRARTLDAADRRRAQARDDLWWLPEVLRMRAAYDDARRRASSRLRDGRRPGRPSTAASRCCGAASATSRARRRQAAGVRRASDGERTTGTNAARTPPFLASACVRLTRPPGGAPS